MRGRGRGAGELAFAVAEGGPVGAEVELAVGVAEAVEEVGAVEGKLDVEPAAAGEVFGAGVAGGAEGGVGEFEGGHAEGGVVEAEAGGEGADEVVVGAGFAGGSMSWRPIWMWLWPPAW